MGIKLNPFTGFFDLTGSGSGGGSGPAERTSTSFTNVTWTGPSGGEYTITITAGTHGKGINPNVMVYETNGANFDQTFPSVQINASGDVSIKVSETPDNRFNGKILII
jgi:hypothetical protein